MVHSTIYGFLGIGLATSGAIAIAGIVPYSEYKILLLIAYAVIEMVWFVYFTNLTEILSNYKPKAPELLDKVTFVSRMVGFSTDKKFWHRWFIGSKEDDEVHKENIIDLLAYNIYNKQPDQMTAEELNEVDVMLKEGLNNKDFRFVEGRLDHITALKHTMDPIDAVYHPWILYAASGLSQVLAGGLHRLMGFKRMEISINRYKVVYWIHKGSVYPDKPIVFCHGVGIGLLPYMNFIYRLYQRKHPVICIEFSHIAMNPINKVISNDEVAEAIRLILDAHHYYKATFAGHSFGTFMMARFCYKFPERIEAAVFIDPVCFQLFMPDVVCKFLYDNPVTVFDYLRHYFISKNLHMNYVLRRHFWWYQLNLWKENMPQKSFVILSENDEFVPVNSVYNYITEGLDSPQDRCIILPNYGHARWLGNNTFCNNFADITVSLAKN